MGAVAKLFSATGITALKAFISPYCINRDRVCTEALEIVKNLLERQLKVYRPNYVLCGNVTYFWPGRCCFVASRFIESVRAPGYGLVTCQHPDSRQSHMHKGHNLMFSMSLSFLQFTMRM